MAGRGGKRGRRMEGEKKNERSCCLHLSIAQQSTPNILYTFWQSIWRRETHLQHTTMAHSQ